MDTIGSTNATNDFTPVPYLDSNRSDMDSFLIADMDTKDLKKLLVRLCENDVEYNDMKNLCKSNLLGGKDMKYKLRAKLIKQVRDQLGDEPTWDRSSYGVDFKLPSEMSNLELLAFYEERNIVKPEDQGEAIGFAAAIMAQDGIHEAVDSPTANNYDSYSIRDLQEECRSRNLPSNGNKSDMIARLGQYDAERERQYRRTVSRAATVLEQERASIYVPPQPPNKTLRAKLEDAVATAASIGGMTLPQLRWTAQGRGLPVYGTVEALQGRISEVLRREAVEAHAGKDRLLRYAQAAVAKLTQEEVMEALAMRGQLRSTGGGAEDEAIRLITTLVDEWIQDALYGGGAAGTSTDEGDGDEDLLADMQAAVEEQEQVAVEEQQQQQEEEEEVDMYADSFDAMLGVNGMEFDPVLDLVFVCSGDTTKQREQSLSAARALLPDLQSDSFWGTWNPPVEQEPPPRVDDFVQDPPITELTIKFIDRIIMGVLIHVDYFPSIPMDQTTYLVITATPVSCSDSTPSASTVTVTKECAVSSAVLMMGLQPSTTYEFTAKLRNAAGDGPEAASMEKGTCDRTGVAVTVAYALPSNGTGTGSGGGTDEPKYVVLDWKQVYGASAEELDAKLVSVGIEGQPLREITGGTGTDTVVIPLGPALSNADEGESATVVVGSWNAPEVRQLTASRPAFVAAVRGLGYGALDVLELTANDLSNVEEASRKILAWMEAQNEDPGVSRVAVRLEGAGGHVVASGIGRGVQQVVEGALDLLEEHGAREVVLEIVHPAAVFFTCGVVEAPEGVIALPPTEITYEDLEEDFYAMDLELDKHWAINEGMDAEKLSALVELEKEARRLPPGALGQLPLPSQRAVNITPPISFPAQVSTNIRLAAAKLFQDLGLRDFATFSGWVVPENPLHEAGLVRAAEIAHEMDRAAAAAVEANGSGSGSRSNDAYQPKSFSSLQALHEREQARLADEARALSHPTPASLVSQSDKDNAVDVQDYAYAANEEEPDAAMANLPVLREQGEDNEQSPAVRYGVFAGINLDGRTREDLKKENPPPVADAIPDGAPAVPVPTALPNLAEIIAQDLCSCTLSNGTTSRILFSHMDVSLAGAGDHVGVLAQQAATVGVSLSFLTRQLVSSSLKRHGLPGLAEIPAGPPPDYFADQQEQQQLDFYNLGGEDGWGEGALATKNMLVEVNENAPASVSRTMQQIAAELEGWEGARSAPWRRWGLPSQDWFIKELREEAPEYPYIIPVPSPDELLESYDAIRGDNDDTNPFSYGSKDGEEEMMMGVGGFGGFRGGRDEEMAAAAREAAALRSAADAGLPDLISASGTSMDYDDEEESGVLGRVLGLGQVSGRGGGGGGQDGELLGDADDLQPTFPGLHPTRQRVWILCGGEGADRDASIHAAAHAVAVLNNEQDLLVETFFLDPYDAGPHERERRQVLLNRRLDLLKIGAEDENLVSDCPEYHPTRIRHPTPPHPEDLEWRGVWRLSASSVLRPNVADLAAGCEAALAAGTTCYLNREEDDVIHRQELIVKAAQEELRLGGVTLGGASPWGGYLDYQELPRYSFLKEWVERAQEECVVVLLAIPGNPIGRGPLQRLLQSKQVPFTGPSSFVCERCADRPGLLRDLGGADPEKPFYHTLDLNRLGAICKTLESANDFHALLFGEWPDKRLIIRPAQSCGGLGVMRAASGRDLQVYCAAVKAWADTIPAEAVEGEDEDVQMPVPPPMQFIMEPASGPVRLTLRMDEERGEGSEVRAGAQGDASNENLDDALVARLQRPPQGTKERWLEVKACLVGSSGAVNMLSLTTTVLQTIRNPTTGEDVVVGSFELTPIPPSILPPDRFMEVQQRLQHAADTLAISGAAQFTALVETHPEEACQVIIKEVEVHPDLSPEGLLLRQAAAAPTPVPPKEVLRELLKIGMTRDVGMEETASGRVGMGLYDGFASSLANLDGSGDGGEEEGGELKNGTSGSVSGSSNSRGHGQEGQRGDAAAAAIPVDPAAQYWGDAGLEIEPIFLGLTRQEIEEEILRQREAMKHEQMSKKGGVGGGRGGVL